MTNPVNGCTSTASAVVTQDITPPLAVCTCSGMLTCTTTSVTICVNGGASEANRTYAWSGPGGFSSTLQCAVVSAPGTYSVVVTNTLNGCTASCVVVVTADKTPPPCSIGDVSPANLICNHGNYTIATGLDPALYTFAWSISVDGNPPGWAIVGSNTGQSITFSSGNCGASGFLVHVSLTVTSKANGCTSTCFGLSVFKCYFVISNRSFKIKHNEKTILDFISDRFRKL